MLRCGNSHAARALARLACNQARRREQQQRQCLRSLHCRVQLTGSAIEVAASSRTPMKTSFMISICKQEDLDDLLAAFTRSMHAAGPVRASQ